jgi:hypothetical protein
MEIDPMGSADAANEDAAENATAEAQACYRHSKVGLQPSRHLPPKRHAHYETAVA